MRKANNCKAGQTLFLGSVCCLPEYSVYNSYCRLSAFLYQLQVLSSAHYEMQRLLHLAQKTSRLLAAKVTFGSPIIIGKAAFTFPFSIAA
jgi:hypothetical protein